MVSSTIPKPKTFSASSTTKNPKSIDPLDPQHLEPNIFMTDDGPTVYAQGWWDPLSNFYDCKFYFDGMYFRSVEHAYQYQKAVAFDQYDLLPQILKAQRACHAKSLCSKLQSPEWNRYKGRLMYDLLVQKYIQIPNFRNKLLLCAGSKIIHNVSDDFWGWGRDKKSGKNVFGVLLSNVLTQMTSDPHRPQSRPKQQNTSKSSSSSSKSSSSSSSSSSSKSSSTTSTSSFQTVPKSKHSKSPKPTQPSTISTSNRFSPLPSSSSLSCTLSSPVTLHTLSSPSKLSSSPKSTSSQPTTVSSPVSLPTHTSSPSKPPSSHSKSTLSSQSSPKSPLQITWSSPPCPQSSINTPSPKHLPQNSELSSSILIPNTNHTPSAPSTPSNGPIPFSLDPSPPSSPCPSLPSSPDTSFHSTSVPKISSNKQNFNIKPTRHPSTKQKLQSWSLPKVSASILVFGTSNLSSISRTPRKDIQIESYPGCQIRHVEHLVRNYKGNSKPQSIILDIGINDADNAYTGTTRPNLKKMVSAIRHTFPDSDLYIPQVQFSNKLSSKKQENLKKFNEELSTLKSVTTLPPLSKGFFIANDDPYNVHWTNSTANALLKNWIHHLND